jgi:CxxC motif-containing protein (DUF1111 family)
VSRVTRLEKTFVAALLAAACGCGKGVPLQPPDSGPAAIVDVAGQTAQVDLAGGAYGDTLPGLSSSDLALFQAGRLAFIHDESAATGLGPVFNETFCSSCHDAPPAIGGTNQRLERRFGRMNPDGSFDPLTSLGGTLLHDHGIGRVPGFNFGGETLPAQANVVAPRRTQPLFGLGLVDATPDSSFRAIAEYEKAHSPQSAGRAATVVDLGTGLPSVGKFGWKSQVPTLLQFAGDAALNEMGITSPLFPNEVCPGGDCSLLQYNPVPAINDPGGEKTGHFADFMRLLGPPPAAALAANASGAQVFESIGCASCHLPLIVTGPNPNPAFDRVAFHPYSDFLLHDMGTLGDGIVQGDAQTREMRTAPLWGLSAAGEFLHDGRVADVSAAIDAHDGQGVASRAAFDALDAADRAALLAFLGSL